MPSKFTENLGLNLWDASDRVHHEDFNTDNRKIDEAVRKSDGRIDGLARDKADQSALDALRGVVDGKASQSDLNNLKSTVNSVSARAGSELLASVTLKSTSQQVLLDVSKVDWSSYSIVVVSFEPANDVDYNSPFGGGRGASVFLLFPMRSPDTRLMGLGIYQTSSPPPYISSDAFRTYTAFSYYSTPGFAAGTKAKIIGIH